MRETNLVYNFTQKVSIINSPSSEARGRAAIVEDETLKLKFVRPFDGAYVQKIDEGSQLQTCHSANTNALFKQELFFWVERGRDRRMFGNVLGKDEYIVMRTRSRVDREGHFLGGRYSMIVGGLSFGWCYKAFGFLGFKSYINPTFNDPNLEEMNVYNTPNFKTIGGSPKKGH